MTAQRRGCSLLLHRARARSGGSSERQAGCSFTASTGLSPERGLQASHTAQGSRSASGSADGTTSRWVMEKARENAPSRRSVRLGGRGRAAAWLPRSGCSGRLPHPIGVRRIDGAWSSGHWRAIGAAEAAVQRPLLIADHEPVEQDRHRPPGTWRSGGPVSCRAGWAGQQLGLRQRRCCVPGRLGPGCARARGCARCG